MISVKVTRVEGLRELEQTLKNLPRATAKSVLVRSLKKRAEPIADTMRALVPDDPTTPETQDLRGSIAVSTRLSKRQARLHRRETKNDRDFAEVFVGAGPLPHAHMQEFGTINHGPQPFARPAWDQHQNEVLDGLKDDLWTEIKRAADRLARKVKRVK